AEFQPCTLAESVLVETMAVCRWAQAGLREKEQASAIQELRKQSQPGADVVAFASAHRELKLLALISRYEATLDRRHSRALRNFIRFRARRQSAFSAAIPAVPRSKKQ